MKSVCVVVQGHFETDIRVMRKAEALVGAGYDVDVLALRSSYSKGKAYSVRGINVHTIGLGKKRGSIVRYLYEYLAFFCWTFIKVTLLTRKKRYTVVDINNLPDFLVFAAIYARWKGATVVFDMHEITPEFYMSKYKMGPSSWFVGLLKMVERASFNFADYVITINKPIEDLLISRGLPLAKSTIITNSVDEEFFTRVAAETPVPALATVERPQFLMMYHGTATHIYGLDIAIDAFAAAHSEMPGAELWILGKGSEMSALEALTRKHGLESKVKFVGLVPPQEIPQWLKLCHVGIVPTRQDVFLDLSFSSKISEYIISGKAIIASRLRTIRAHFSEQALAYFEPHQSADMARQMIDLYKNPSRRQALADNALKEFQPIRWEVMKARYLRLMASITEPAARQSSSHSVESAQES